MAPKLVIAVAVFAIVLCAGAQAAGYRARGPLPDCKRRHSHTIYESQRVRLFWVRDRNYDEHDYACNRDSNKRISLGVVWESDSDSRFDFQERGEWLGFVDLWGTKDVEGMNANALNIRTGQLNSDGDQFTLVRSYGLTRRGSIAWIQSPEPDVGDPTDYAVYLRVRGAKRRFLDSGSDIDPRSLAVGGHHVYWVRGGAVRTAAIP